MGTFSRTIADDFKGDFIMIEIYLGDIRSLISTYRNKHFIIDVDSYFNTTVYGRYDIDQKHRESILRIEQTDYIDHTGFHSRLANYAYVALDKLSTVSKAIICSAIENLVVSGFSCGRNALLEMFKQEQAGVYFDSLPELDIDIQNVFVLRSDSGETLIQEDCYKDLFRRYREWSEE